MKLNEQDMDELFASPEFRVRMLDFLRQHLSIDVDVAVINKRVEFEVELSGSYKNDGYYEVLTRDSSSDSIED